MTDDPIKLLNLLAGKTEMIPDAILQYLNARQTDIGTYGHAIGEPSAFLYLRAMNCKPVSKTIPGFFEYRSPEEKDFDDSDQMECIVSRNASNFYRLIDRLRGNK